MDLKVERFDHAALLVRDLAASKIWYRDVFGFEPLDTSPNTPYIGTAVTKLALLQVGDVTGFASPVSQGARACHIAFRTDRETFLEYQRRLPGMGIHYEKLTHSDSQSIYFSDPDGYFLEVTTYELE